MLNVSELIHTTSCMGPPHIALFVVVDDSLNRCFQSKPFMRSNGVVFDQPIGQFLVEQIEIVKQVVFVIIDKLLRYGAVERSPCAFIFGVFG